MYYPLHVHTAKGSVGDSILKEKEYIAKAKTMGLDRIAMTDHGSMANIYSFYFECVKQDIVPILGCEVYLVNNREDKTEKYTHLVLLSQTLTGFRNLLTIVSDAEINGKYKKPRTNYEMLSKHSEGLIALSACLGGSIPRMILQDQEEDKTNEILQEIERFKIIFDGRFYLELQPGTFEEQLIVNEELCKLSKLTNTPLVITNDIHYLNEEDWFAHDIHVKIQRKQKFDEPMNYPDKVYYLMDEADLRCRMQHTIPADCLEEGIRNAELIAKSCNVELQIKGINMPHVDIPKAFTPHDYLEYLVIQSINQKANRLKNPAAYIDRAFYELDVIKKLGFSEYFLTIKDIIDHARSKGIYVGPGRGSVCGSIVAYLCGMTHVDPIKYNLLFERFLSEHRVGSVPDVDIDFASKRRKEMFTYSIDKHGLDKCAQVSTFSMRKAKSSLRDVGRVYSIDSETVDAVCKLIPIAYYDEDGEKSVDLSIEDSLKVVPELRSYQEANPEWFDLAMKLEDLPRATSIHAAGTLIASTPLIEAIPLLSKKDEEILATSLNLSDAEAAGLSLPKAQGKEYKLRGQVNGTFLCVLIPKSFNYQAL